MAKASLPIPLLVGSTTVRVIAVASAASTALPPCFSACNPAWAANGCDVATTFSASTGIRCDRYGSFQLKVIFISGLDYLRTQPQPLVLLLRGVTRSHLPNHVLDQPRFNHRVV